MLQSTEGRASGQGPALPVKIHGQVHLRLAFYRARIAARMAHGRSGSRHRNPDDAGAGSCKPQPAGRLCVRFLAARSTGGDLAVTPGPHSRRRRLGAAIVVFLAFIPIGRGHDTKPFPDRQPALIIAYHTTTANWLAFRKSLRKETLPRFRSMQTQGILRSYRVLFNRDLDSGGWNAMAILEFDGNAGQERWMQGARELPAGLSQDELALTSRIESTPASLVRRDHVSSSASAPVYLVIPYRYQVSDSAYLKYLDGYAIPEFKGWEGAGVLAGYSVLLARYPAGRPWSAMLLLEYRSDRALAARDSVKAAVRERLSHDPAWKAISDRKLHVRDELALTVADGG
ncbi:MAG: hypothetical protein KGH73_00715 [Xanthomonadaceae bacterium]|nr:hypothetical protein [Xanthomonadaceae bacterium]